MPRRWEVEKVELEVEAKAVEVEVARHQQLILATTMSLTQDQARALWDAGGFAVLQGLPSGSEVGMDGV